MKLTLTRVFGILMAVALFCGVLFSQTKTLVLPKPTRIPAPGNIQLLDGYVYESRTGIDSFVGAIKRKDGFEIRHDIGRLAGNYAIRYFEKDNNEVQWTNRQTLDGDDLLIAFLKDGRIIATYPKSTANFMAKISSQEDLAQFLLTVLTYRPPKPQVIGAEPKN